MPKKTYPENIQKLKEQLETGNNLVDYFFVCGVEPTICQNQDLYNISDDNYLENINKTIKPSILCKFPEFDNNNDTIDESIISYCFPNGFEIIHSASSDPKRKIFSIILDNNLFSSEYPQKYLTCILFYEKLSQYKKLQQQMEKIEKNKDNDFIDLDETLISSIRSSLKDEKNVNIHRHNKILTSILPSINIDDHVIEDPNMGKLEIGNMRNTLNQPIFKLKYYYIPKCICLVSIHPYIKLYQKILSNIYSYGCSVNNEIPIEKIITNLIIEVPIPPRGLYSINYNYNFNFNEKSSNTNSNSNTSVSRAQSVAFVLTSQSQVQVVQPLQSTENNKLLISEIDLKRFNRNLSFICKLETIKHILLGSKILFFSLNVNTLTDTILSFLNLVFPFKYPFQVTSFLHKNNYNILESISPFIMGICEEYSENFFEKNDITLEGMNVFIVDLDKQDGQKNYHLFSDEEFPDFPSKLVSNLEKEIKSLESNTIQNNDNINKEKIIKEFNEQYQEKFFHFFCEILKGYEEYLNMDFFKSDTDNVTSIETLFNCDQFIKSSYHYQSDFPFYTKFINDSQLFADFIYKRMIPSNNNELMDILIVNDYLASFKKRYKRKDAEENEYIINNKYMCPRPRELSEEEITKIFAQKVELSQKGQIVKKLKPDTKKIYNNSCLVFDYTIFPVLDFSIYCNNENINQYIPPPDYSEEIDAINSDVISKSSLGQNMNRTLEMKNYLYLTWLEIWAFTFWYNEIGEKHYRFDQMLDVLDKVIHHEMNIFNLMFDVLNKHGEPQMMLKLYQKLLQKKINPSFYIYDIMSKVLDKKQIKNLLEELKKNYSKELKFNDYNRKNNRERTFLSITDDLPFETKPRFYYDYYCISCGEKINIFSISKKFEDIRNDILWVKCKKCGEYNLPKIIVKFGLDFINTQSKATPTEDFVLHSPYNLKINIRNAVVTHYGMDINIPNFKSQFQPLFWNFIWYCVIHGLDYNILLPYSKNLEQLKETLFYNPNREIFEVSYDDSAFKENQNKIERISTRIKQQNNEIDKKHTFEILKICSEVIKLELGGEGEEEYNEGNSFEIKEDTGNEKEDLENFMKIRPKIKMFAELEGLDDQKEDEKKKEDEKDEEQLIKEAEEHNEALFPTSW
jgi:hypothetical protein